MVLPAFLQRVPFIKKGYVPGPWELFTGVIPTWLGYEPYFKNEDEPMKGYVASAAVLLAILIALVLRRITKRNQMVAEALATGYFLALWRPVAQGIKQHGGRLGAGGAVVKRVEIHMPATEDDLLRLEQDFAARRADGTYTNMDLGLPGRSKNLDCSQEEGRVVVHDYPNTLNSLRSYFRFDGADDYSNKRSARYHEWFRERLERLHGMEGADMALFKIV